jgi:hypothetical protein
MSKERTEKEKGKETFDKKGKFCIEGQLGVTQCQSLCMHSLFTVSLGQ